MTTPQEIIVRQTEVGIFNPPDVVLANARTAAKALQDVIANKPDPVIMNGHQYLEFDDWQLCGQFYGYTVRTGNAVLVEIDGVKGAKAHADLISLKTGEIIGGAEAYCMRDEPKWNTRTKYEWQGEGKDRRKVKAGDEPVPWFQLASMAQTRAGAKALRNRLAWVVVLAGYKATPAEEIGDGITEKQSEAGHWCHTHNIAFFKRGKMLGYAHPLDDGGWCNEPPPEATKPPTEKDATLREQEKPPDASTKAKTTGSDELEGIDESWLTDSLKKLSGWKVGAWLHEHYPQAEGARVRDILKNMTVEERKEFGKEVQKRLELS